MPAHPPLYPDVQLCEESHQLRGSFLFLLASLCSDCLDTDPITIRRLWDGAQKYERAWRGWLNEQIQHRGEHSCVCRVWSLREAWIFLPLAYSWSYIRFSVFMFWRSIHATVISIVERPVAHSVAFSPRWLRHLSCQLWLSPKALWGEYKSCLCWTAVLVPACSLALVSGPVISVLGLSRQPAQIPTSQRRARPRRDRCQQPAAPTPTLVPGRCRLRLSHVFEAEQLGKKGHLCHPFTVAISQETGAPSLCERDMEHPQEKTVPVQEHSRRGLRPNWLTHWLTALLCPLMNGDERILMKRPCKHRPYSQTCSGTITCSFVCVVVSLYRACIFWLTTLFF